MDRSTLCILLLCCFGITVFAADNIVRRGNKLVGSRSGVDVAGAIFLMRDGTLTDGIWFAVRAFFRSDSPIRFQVWRPVMTVNDTTRQFKLVGEIRVIPSVIDRVEDVYLASVNIAKRECLRVKDGDQLGIYMEESPGAVAYAFDPSNPMALGYTLDNASIPIRVNERVLFDSLTFPYDFSLAAYVYTDLSGVDPNEATPTCPRVLIPSDEGLTYPTSQAPTPPTGAPGATGPIGPQGFTGATGMQGMPGSNGFTGGTGPQGPKGNAGNDGPAGPMGPRGSMGVDGATGATGAQGPKGDRGERGPPGNSQGGPDPDADESRSMFTDPMMVMGLLIWLILVTLMLMVVLLLLIYFIRRNRKDDKEKIKTSTLDEGAIHGDKKRPVSVHSTARPLWMDSMKEEQSKDYTNDTIERDYKDKVVYENDINIQTQNDPPARNGSVSREELTNY